METVERKLRKTRTGVVTSNKMEKTITVSIERKVIHPLYGKFLKKSKKWRIGEPWSLQMFHARLTGAGRRSPAQC